MSLMGVQVSMGGDYTLITDNAGEWGGGALHTDIVCVPPTPTLLCAILPPMLYPVSFYTPLPIPTQR